jgi:hypothetical protein
MAGVAGLEPVTSGVTGRRSNQLSYTPIPYRGRFATPSTVPKSSMPHRGGPYLHALQICGAFAAKTMFLQRHFLNIRPRSDGVGVRTPARIADSRPDRLISALRSDQGEDSGVLFSRRRKAGKADLLTQVDGGTLRLLLGQHGASAVLGR